MLLYLAELVVVLTFSRAGIAVAALAALGVARARARPARVARSAVVASRRSPALVALWCVLAAGADDDLQSYADRVNDGAWFGLVAFGGLRSSRLRRVLARRVELPDDARAYG